MSTSDAPLLALFAAIASADDRDALRRLEASPALATARLDTGATRAEPHGFFFEAIRHGVYAGDTALHVAAAAFRARVVDRLVALGADVRAKNRRGAEPLHYAVDGVPGEAAWDPRAQALVVAALLDAGADANARDKGGVGPLHRAARNRCAAAVRVLLERGADPRAKSGSGATALDLATRTTGRGGSGSPEARRQQTEILRLLRARG